MPRNYLYSLNLPIYLSIYLRHEWFNKHTFSKLILYLKKCLRLEKIYNLKEPNHSTEKNIKASKKFTNIMTRLST